ncbi:MAG: putative selenate reductase subunit YgfK, partial [Spirochaetales bacterium]|nr:putative selenate reductase subunit YgfK [Spirochaetales bacterium]
MADIMRPVSLTELFTRSFAEYRQKKSIFDIPEEHFYRPSAAHAPTSVAAHAPIFSSSAVNPIGPAAGPHTQLAQNILTSYLTGSRYFELKTVQILDTLEIEKPCIDIRDEGYNVEWSSEFTLDKAYDEYLKAWFLLHLFDFLLFGNSPDKPPAFLFNMSVGYDLEGIKSEKMDRFINRLIDSSDDELFAKYAEVIRDLPAEFFAGTPWIQNAENIQEIAGIVPVKLCESVTLSTMHGCPPDEIESICRYMITEKKLDTLVKLNPTLLGFDRVRSILDNLGFDYVRLKRQGFEADLQYPDAVPMLKRLKALAEKEGRFFGVKLTNTLAAANDGSVLPGDEMYLSGRALYPLTINLADQLASEFDGELPMSFSGGVSAWNIEDVIKAGIKPVTIATDLLRPGGFSRLKEIAERAENQSNAWFLDRVDPELVRKAAADSLSAEYLAKDFRGSEGVSVPEDLPFTDCFVAPCIVTCPISQDVPEYVHLAGEGRYEEAFGIIYDRNPLPFMTGYLCDHECTSNCTRMDWEGSVDIRDMKRIAAEQGYEAFRKSGSLTERQVASRGKKAAVIGAGPAGLSAAAFLAREGIEVHVFEKEARSGGVLSYVIPQFRVPEKTVERDLSLLEDL